ncbi:hypothetical protein [Intestinibacter bartlettii]|uniref:hypothetical protein n=1 Tax=Intestinibacter bartlettii TaxID=261299 RepID=UPI00319E80B9
MVGVNKHNNQDEKKKQAEAFIKAFELNQGEGMIIAKSAVTNSRVLKLGNKCDNKSSKKKHRMLVNNVIEGKK